jgi:hypothetical protein
MQAPLPASSPQSTMIDQIHPRALRGQANESCRARTPGCDGRLSLVDEPPILQFADAALVFGVLHGSASMSGEHVGHTGLFVSPPLILNSPVTEVR